MNRRWLRLGIIIGGIYLIWVSAKGLWDLRKAGGRLDQAQQNLRQAQQENRELQQKLKEVSSDEFVEREARDKLNLQKPGETVVILADDKLQMTNDKLQTDRQVRQVQNWEKWWNLFFGE